MSFEQWIAHTYYGRNVNKSPRTGAHYHMIDEHIQNILEKNGLMFEEKLNRLTTDFCNETKDSLKEMRESIKNVERRNIASMKVIDEMKKTICTLKKELKDSTERVIQFIEKGTMECTKQP